MTTSQNTAPNYESVWAILQETAKRQQETDRILTEKFAETAKRQQETDRITQENAKAIKEIQKSVGGWGNNFGKFAEDYFYNSFEQGEKNFFGKRFDRIAQRLKSDDEIITDEYDIVMYNADAIAIIEVKFTAEDKDIKKVLKKADTFRIFYPKYKKFNIYLGLASMSFYPELEQKCIENGIAIIKQLGDKIVICDEHLKSF